MVDKILKLAGIFFLTTVCVSAQPVAYNWFDGDIKKTVWLQPDQIVEFGKGSHVKNADNSAVSVFSGKNATIWKIQNRKMIRSVQAGKGINGVDPSKISPVFTSGKNGGNPTALPGGIVICFNDGITKTEAMNFLNRNRLKLDKHLFGNYYAVKYQSGIESLSRANELRGMTEVKQAFPSWWKAMETR